MRCVLSDATGNRYPVGYCLQSGNVTELRVADLLRLRPVRDAGMHWRTYWRMQVRHDAIAYEALAGTMARLRRMVAWR